MNSKLGHLIKSTHFLCGFCCHNVRVDLKNAYSVFCNCALLTGQRHRLCRRCLEEPKEKSLSLRLNSSKQSTQKKERLGSFCIHRFFGVTLVSRGAQFYRRLLIDDAFLLSTKVTTVAAATSFKC